MVEFKVLENGKLRLVLDGDADTADDIREMLAKWPVGNVLLEITEAYWTNGWGVFPSVADLWQMSDAPAIVEEYTVEDDGSQTLNGRGWYFPNYMVESEIDTLLERGYVDFDFWANFDNFNVPAANDMSYFENGTKVLLQPELPIEYN